jgi:hypothetical protein
MKDRTNQEPTSRRWAWRIGSLAGISIYLHATFVLLLGWIALHRAWAPVREVMHARFPVAGAREELDDVLARLPADGSAVAVFEHDQLVGLLDAEHIDRLLAGRGVSAGGSA